MGTMGFQGKGRPVVPLSWDKKKSLSCCPFVSGQEQHKKSRDKLLCPGTIFFSKIIISLLFFPFCPTVVPGYSWTGRDRQLKSHDLAQILTGCPASSHGKILSCPFVPGQQREQENLLSKFTDIFKSLLSYLYTVPEDA